MVTTMSFRFSVSTTGLLFFPNSSEVDVHTSFIYLEGLNNMDSTLKFFEGTNKVTRISNIAGSTFMFSRFLLAPYTKNSLITSS